MKGRNRGQAEKWKVQTGSQLADSVRDSSHLVTGPALSGVPSDYHLASEVAVSRP